MMAGIPREMIDNWVKDHTVHNHGTEEGPGLACPEFRLPNGSLRGACMSLVGKTTLGPINIPVLVGGRRQALVGHASFFKTDDAYAELRIELHKESVPMLEAFFELWDLLTISFYARPGHSRPITPESLKNFKNRPEDDGWDTVSSAQNQKPTTPISTPRLEIGVEAGPYITKALNLVHDYVLTHESIMTDDPRIPVRTSIVWFCKTLQNWKAMVITNLADEKYYEVTYDGDQHRTYIDEYEKKNNVVIHD